MEELATLKGSCHMCGKCCEAIHIKMSPEEIKRSADVGRRRGGDDTTSDAVFIDQHWNPITQEEAFRINPYLKEQHAEIVRDYGEERANYNYSRLHYYTCTQLDPVTKTCTIHDIRPHVCSGYPWYGRAPESGHMFYSAECGYRADVEGGEKTNGND